jgi:hypothetical protein
MIPRLPDLRAVAIAERREGVEMTLPLSDSDPVTFRILLDACMVTRNRGYR